MNRAIKSALSTPVILLLSGLLQACGAPCDTIDMLNTDTDLDAMVESYDVDSEYYDEYGPSYNPNLCADIRDYCKKYKKAIGEGYSNNACGNACEYYDDGWCHPPVPTFDPDDLNNPLNPNDPEDPEESEDPGNPENPGDDVIPYSVTVPADTATGAAVIGTGHTALR